MREGCPSIISLLARCLSLRCPACGRSSVFQSRFRVRHHCPSCRALFEREEGFFVGAIMVNVVTTEMVILVAYIACLLTVGFSEELIFTVLLPAAVIFPVGFYRHSWSVWLSLDHLVERLPQDERPSGDLESDN